MMSSGIRWSLVEVELSGGIRLISKAPDGVFVVAGGTRCVSVVFGSGGIFESAGVRQMPDLTPPVLRRSPERLACGHSPDSAPFTVAGCPVSVHRTAELARSG